MNSLTFVGGFPIHWAPVAPEKSRADHRQETGQVAQRQALSGGRSLGAPSLFLKGGAYHIHIILYHNIS